MAMPGGSRETSGLEAVTAKSSGNRMAMDELAVYQVKDGKIVREEFFYTM